MSWQQAKSIHVREPRTSPSTAGLLGAASASHLVDENFTDTVRLAVHMRLRDPRKPVQDKLDKATLGYGATDHGIGDVIHGEIADEIGDGLALARALPCRHLSQRSLPPPYRRLWPARVSHTTHIHPLSEPSDDS
jgi:hypothetical protein